MPKGPIFPRYASVLCMKKSYADARARTDEGDAVRDCQTIPMPCRLRKRGNERDNDRWPRFDVLFVSFPVLQSRIETRMIAVHYKHTYLYTTGRSYPKWRNAVDGEEATKSLRSVKGRSDFALGRRCALSSIVLSVRVPLPSSPPRLFFSPLFSLVFFDAFSLSKFRSTAVSFYYCPTLGFTHQKKNKFSDSHQSHLVPLHLRLL